MGRLICEMDRLFVRGPGVMIGYLNDTLATRQKIDSRRMVRYRRLSPSKLMSGMMRILGRADDVIVLPNGFKIHPQSVERTLESIDGVQWAVLIPGQEELIVAIQGVCDD